MGDDLLSEGTKLVLEKLAEHAVKEGFQKLSRESARSQAHRALTNWAAQHDYVFFDFSDWTVKDLCSSTTSYVVGIPAGTLIVKANGKTARIECSGMFDTLVGSDIVFLYKWCRAEAPNTSDHQRRFRFEDGRYAGEGEIKSKYKVGMAAAGLLVVAAKLFS